MVLWFVFWGSRGEERQVYLVFDHLSLRYQCDTKVAMFMRKSTYWIGSKENSRTLGKKDFRPSCHFYGSSS